MKKRITRSDTQAGLFDPEIFNPDNLKMRGRVLTLEDIEPPAEQTRGSAAFVNNVKQYGGIFEPIVTQLDEGSGKQRIVEGRRRYWAVRDLAEAGELPPKTKLPASEIMGLPVDLPREVVQAFVSLMLNHLRGDNLAADAASLRTLIGAGATEHDLKKFAGLNPQTIKVLTGLSRVIKPLQKAFEEGRIADGVVLQIAKLPVPLQERLAATLKTRIGEADKEKKAGVKLTAEDVREVKSVQTRAVVEALPQDLFANDAPAQVSPTAFHVAQLERLKATLPAQAKTTQIEKGFARLVELLGKVKTPEAATAPG